MFLCLSRYLTITCECVRLLYIHVFSYISVFNSFSTQKFSSLEWKKEATAKPTTENENYNNKVTHTQFLHALCSFLFYQISKGEHTRMEFFTHTRFGQEMNILEWETGNVVKVKLYISMLVCVCVHHISTQIFRFN